ncbi:hypothetical protein [Glycomyces sp. NPDC048151]|uniref:hypothetical protein n=1 Tax=Glycomyces sp. NPDC048151 TaxID=3364002 RepID=UPI00371655E2
MDFSDIGAWIAVTAALSVLGRAYVATIALRGTRPRERAEILRALPSFLPGHRLGPVPETVEEEPTSGIDPGQ